MDNGSVSPEHFGGPLTAILVTYRSHIDDLTPVTHRPAWALGRLFVRSMAAGSRLL